VLYTLLKKKKRAKASWSHINPEAKATRKIKWHSNTAAVQPQGRARSSFPAAAACQERRYCCCCCHQVSGFFNCVTWNTAASTMRRERQGRGGQQAVLPPGCLLAAPPRLPSPGCLHWHIALFKHLSSCLLLVLFHRNLCLLADEQGEDEHFSWLSSFQGLEGLQTFNGILIV